MYNTKYSNLGETDYKEAWDYQESLFEDVVAIKLHNRDNPADRKEMLHHLLFVEHPHVFTLGKSGAPTNLLITDELLEKIGAKFYRINRGGDITYHGPGQVVGYPIFDLEAMNLGIKEYIHLLEEGIIMTLRHYGINGARLDGATGVWLDVNDPQKARKICAIGVRASRFVSMHGFALNVNTNLDYFRYINPCGFIDKGVTSLQNELNRPIPLAEIHEHLLKAFKELFNLNFV
ncbi:lipoyl(octanoyl) transferase LipB [Alkaliflexus imshenetskii]|uniref:lipoyl(octanoyl) transferase LipB n=1 Tax=Alkaliflexus imshenetskii TaxID=286730 RepID=UPI00047D7D85|nr:lipoyl(octanoyl) transferase LipB [Alkaliflexus imshenetskii]